MSCPNCKKEDASIGYRRKGAQWEVVIVCETSSCGFLVVHKKNLPSEREALRIVNKLGKKMKADLL